MAANAVPNTLKAFSLFVDGVGLGGTTEEIELPTLTIQGEDHRSGGMNAPIKLDMGLEALEMSFTLSDYNPVVLNQMGIPGVDAVSLTARGALSRESVQTATPVRVRMRGSFQKFEPGTWKAGDKTMPKYELSLTYYQYSQDNRVIHEIDVLNMIRIVNGVDVLAAQRAIIGA